MDADGDGKVSKEQFLANSADRFAASDANKDGMLTFDEFREAHW